MDSKVISLYRHHGDQHRQSETVVPESRAIWYRKIDELNKQIEELVDTRNHLYRLMLSSVSDEITDADYAVLDECHDYCPERDGSGPRTARDFT